nr:hypothetical protein MACL_00002851 [Theileria orientalis]
MEVAVYTKVRNVAISPYGKAMWYWIWVGTDGCGRVVLGMARVWRIRLGVTRVWLAMDGCDKKATLGNGVYWCDGRCFGCSKNFNS